MAQSPSSLEAQVFKSNLLWIAAPNFMLDVFHLVAATMCSNCMLDKYTLTSKFRISAGGNRCTGGYGEGHGSGQDQGE